MTTTTRPPREGCRMKTLIGNLTHDPNLRYSAKGEPWTTCGLAVNGDEESRFYDLVTFGSTAMRLARLPKGALVSVVGKVETTAWTDHVGRARTGRRMVAQDLADAPVPEDPAMDMVRTILRAPDPFAVRGAR